MVLIGSGVWSLESGVCISEFSCLLLCRNEARKEGYLNNLRRYEDQDCAELFENMDVVEAIHLPVELAKQQHRKSFGRKTSFSPPLVDRLVSREARNIVNLDRGLDCT